MCPVDKAVCNITFTYKNFYLERFGKELVKPPSYEKVLNECEAEIIQKHVEFCKGFKIEIQ